MQHLCYLQLDVYELEREEAADISLVFEEMGGALSAWEKFKFKVANLLKIARSPSCILLGKRILCSNIIRAGAETNETDKAALLRYDVLFVESIGIATERAWSVGEAAGFFFSPGGPQGCC